MLELWERGERLAAVCEEWLYGARARLAAAMAKRDDAARPRPGTTRPSDPARGLPALSLGKADGRRQRGRRNESRQRAIRRIDATQRRFTPTAFVYGVIKKYGDDNGGVLVSNLAYSAFVSLFPLLLILVTILGLIASADPSFREVP